MKTSIALALSATLSQVALAVDRKEMVAACIVLEAGGEGHTGMTAVACVIRNRADNTGLSASQIVQRCHSYKSKKTGNFVTIYQFSCFADGFDKAIKKARKHQLWSEAMALAEQIEEKNLGPDITHGATHYHTTSVSPYWTNPENGGKNDKAITTATIGNHVFLRNVD